MVGQIQADQTDARVAAYVATFAMALTQCTDPMQLPGVCYTAALARLYEYACSSPHRCNLTCRSYGENSLTPEQLYAKILK